MYQWRIGLLGVLAAAVITVACGTTDARGSSKGKTDTTKEQGSGPSPGSGHEKMEKGMKMEGKDHPKEGKR
jgi:hypothetical protein